LFGKKAKTTSESKSENGGHKRTDPDGITDDESDAGEYVEVC